MRAIINHVLPFIAVGAVADATHINTDRLKFQTKDAADVESDAQPAGQVSNRSSTTPAVLAVTQIVPHGSPRRIDADPPTC